jgi:ketosteroid isomerase-like protein
MKGRGRGSGVETTQESWQVWRFREGRAYRWEEYLDRTEALEAVGLRE